MKKLFVPAAIALLVALTATTALAQATASQSVTLAVNPVYRIGVSGNPGPLTVVAGDPGSNSLTSVSNSATSFAVTHNVAAGARITAHMDAALAAGYTLQVALGSAGGTSAGTVDISNALAASAVDVVNGIPRGASTGQNITYTFSALATAGELSSTTRTVTFTLTSP